MSNDSASGDLLDFGPAEDCASDGMRLHVRLPGLRRHVRHVQAAAVNRIAVTAAALTAAAVLAAFTATPAATMPRPAGSTARHVVVCNWYVSNAAMVAENALNIIPTAESFCVVGGG